MAKDYRNLRTEMYTKDFTTTASLMGMGSTSGKTEVVFKVILSKECEKARASGQAIREISTREAGWVIKKLGKVNFTGSMATYTKEISTVICAKAKGK